MYDIIFVSTICLTNCLYFANCEDHEVELITSPKQNMLLEPPVSLENGCKCDDNSTAHLLQKASIMQEQIKNKTNVFSKFRHRATHSDEAMWASISLSFLLVLLTLGTIRSKMWKDRPAICYMDSQPVRYERFSRKSEILIKTMLKSRARNLVKYSRSRKQRLRNEEIAKDALNMTSFLHPPEDDVDSKLQSYIQSSSSDSCDDDICSVSSTDDDEGPDHTFSLNKKTGDWERGSIASFTSFLGLKFGSTNRPKEYFRVRVDSSDSNLSVEYPLDSSLARELNRISSSDQESESESAALIKIG